MTELVKILMQRDGITERDANEQVVAAKEALQEYIECGDTEAAYNICEEFFGLEPDFLFDLF